VPTRVNLHFERKARDKEYPREDEFNCIIGIRHDSGRIENQPAGSDGDPEVRRMCEGGSEKNKRCDGCFHLDPLELRSLTKRFSDQDRERLSYSSNEVI